MESVSPPKRATAFGRLSPASRAWCWWIKRVPRADALGSMLGACFARCQNYCFCKAANAANTSSLCGVGFTFIKTCATFPFGSMMKVLRAEYLVPL